MKNYDLIIIGSGPAGASMACALAKSGLSIAIIERQAPSQNNSQPDGRKLALSYGSQQILEHFSVWENLSEYATPIAQVHVSAEGRFGATRMQAKEIDLPALGYVVPAAQLTQALQKNLAQQTQLTFYCPASVQQLDSTAGQVTIEHDQQTKTLSAKLIIAADGALSHCRNLLNITACVTDYKQSALVTNLTLKKPHQNIAYQRASEMGTLAMLPMQNNTCGFVCTTDTSVCNALHEMEAGELLTQIEKHFGHRFGKLTNLGPRFTYPIKMIIAKQQIQQRCLLLGNAAHNISPVAAQGFNLALQDIYAFCELLKTHTLDNIPALTEAYLAQRQAPQQKIIRLTDRVMQHLKAPHFLGLGLSLLDVLPFKNQLAQQAAGLSAQIKKLRRGQHA